jgi:hypothetical protein
MAVAIDPSKPVARAVGKQVREDTGEVGTSIWGVVVAETHRGRRSMAVEFSRLGTAVVVELVGRLGVKEERGDRWDLRVASPGRTMANEGGGVRVECSKRQTADDLGSLRGGAWRRLEDGGSGTAHSVATRRTNGSSPVACDSGRRGEHGGSVSRITRRSGTCWFKRRGKRSAT